MDNVEVKPQDTRFAAIILALLGGALDVYSHIQYDSFVATQTGNIILMIADLRYGNFEQIYPKLISILLFSLGFLLGIFIKDRAKTAFWRIYTIIPLAISTFIIPLFVKSEVLGIIILAFSTGLMMLTFTGSKIEEHPYTIFMTSGNYRKMISSWYIYFTNRNKRSLIVRQAQNYTIVVVSFVIGALISAFLEKEIHEKSGLVLTFFLLILIGHYVLLIKRHNLEKTNI